MNNLDKESVIGISALLVHAANIDEIYSDHERDLIKSFIKSYLKDHRIYMLSVIAGLTLGGRWIINDPDSIKTSFPSFNKLIMKLGAKIN